MSEWVPILHRDLKLANVFLGAPNKTHYSNYPVPKLGDFGLAAYMPGGELTDYEIFGTIGNFPIEQDPTMMRRKGVDWALTTKANVWGVANIIASLMKQKEGFINWESPEPSEEGPELGEVVFNEKQQDRYNEILRDLVYNCMRFDPDQRPSFAQTLRSIRIHGPSADNDPLRDEPVDSARWGAHLLDPRAINLVCSIQ